MKKIFLALAIILSATACNDLDLDEPTNPHGVPLVELGNALVNNIEQVYSYIPEEYRMLNTDIWVSKDVFPKNSPLREDYYWDGIMTPDFNCWVIIVDVNPAAFLVHEFLFRFVSANDGEVKDYIFSTLPPHFDIEKLEYVDFLLYKGHDRTIPVE